MTKTVNPALEALMHGAGRWLRASDFVSGAAWSLRPAIVLAVVAAGCSANPYQMAPVRGTVMCLGKPVAGGVIKFQPLDAPEKTGRKLGYPGGASQATIAADGSFTLMAIDENEGPGALTGPHQVLFELPPTRRPALTADDRYMMSAEEAKKWEEEFSRRPVYPPCPCTAEISPAEVEVRPGENVFHFTLRPK